MHPLPECIARVPDLLQVLPQFRLIMILRGRLKNSVSVSSSLTCLLHVNLIARMLPTLRETRIRAGAGGVQELVVDPTINEGNQARAIRRALGLLAM